MEPFFFYLKNKILEHDSYHNSYKAYRTFYFKVHANFNFLNIPFMSIIIQIQQANASVNYGAGRGIAGENVPGFYFCIIPAVPGGCQDFVF